MASLKDTVKAINKLIGYWTIEEDSGTLIEDDDTGTFPLTAYGPLVGQASIVPSKPGGKSAFFDGINDYMRRNVPPEFRIPALELLCIIKTTDAWGVGRMWDFCPTGTANDGRGVNGTLGLNNFSIQKGNGAGFVQLSSGAIVSPNTTYAVFAFISGAAMKLFVKEVVQYPEDYVVSLTASNADATAILWPDKFPGVHYPDPGQMYIGASRADQVLVGPDPFGPDRDFGEFYISDFGIFNAELTNEERSAIYQAATLPAPAIGDITEWFTGWKHRQKDGERKAFKTYADFEAMVAANPTTVILEGTHKILYTGHLQNAPDGLYIVKGPAFKRYTWDAAVVVAQRTATPYAVSAPTAAQRGAFRDQIVAMGIA